MTVHCQSCNHQWDLPLKLPMKLERFTRLLKAAATIGCPACGADGKAVLCGPAVPTPTTTEHSRARRGR